MNLYDNDNNELMSSKKISEAERIYKTWKQKYKDTEHIFKLVTIDLCNTIKSYVTVYDYTVHNIEKAFDELTITDKRRKKSNLDWLQNSITENFFNNNATVKIDKMYWFGLNRECVWIEFKLSSTHCDGCYSIRIPLHKNLGHSFDDSYGKFTISRKNSESCYELLSSSYTIEGLSSCIATSLLKPDSELESN